MVPIFVKTCLHFLLTWSLLPWKLRAGATKHSEKQLQVVDSITFINYFGCEHFKNTLYYCKMILCAFYINFLQFVRQNINVSDMLVKRSWILPKKNGQNGQPTI